jgi:ligand-binding sensor domain-containing protein
LYSGSLVDKNGNFIVCGKNSITAIVNGKIICRRSLNFFADQAALDSNGNVWVATRANELTMFTPNINDPANYLEQKKVFSKELSDFSPRSIIIDRNDNIWIGTRSHGIKVFSVNDGELVKKFSITTTSGLSDDFTTHLACDANNNIWACSALGLDKISVSNGVPVIENITKQNNIYQSVFKVVIDKNNTAWGLFPMDIRYGKKRINTILNTDAG